MSQVDLSKKFKKLSLIRKIILIAIPFTLFFYDYSGLASNRPSCEQLKTINKYVAYKNISCSELAKIHSKEVSKFNLVMFIISTLPLMLMFVGFKSKEYFWGKHNILLYEKAKKYFKNT